MQIKKYEPNNNQSLKQLIKDIIFGFIEGRELAWRLYIRDIKAGYRKSFLGFFWMLIPPLATAGLWIFLNKQNVIKVEDAPMNYRAYVLCGTIFWSIFAEAVNKPLQRYQGAMGMMSKLNFPREALLLRSFYDLIFSFLLKLLVLIPILWVLGCPPTINFLMILPFTFGLIMLGLSLGLLITPLGMLYNDVGKALPMLLPFIMYFSPIIYPIKENTLMGFISKLSPATPIIERIRSFIGGYAFEMQFELTLWFLFVMFFFLLGLIILKISLPIIVERNGG